MSEVHVQPTDLAMRDMDVAQEEIATCRRLASEFRQIGFAAYAKHLSDNVKAAEWWLMKAARCYPKRCDNLGKCV